MAGEDCAVCRLIRVYLLFAVPLLALVGVSTLEGGEKARFWLARVELIDILAWGALAACPLPLLRGEGTLPPPPSHGIPRRRPFRAHARTGQV